MEPAKRPYYGTQESNVGSFRPAVPKTSIRRLIYLDETSSRVLLQQVAAAPKGTAPPTPGSSSGLDPNGSENLWSILSKYSAQPINQQQPMDIAERVEIKIPNDFHPGQAVVIFGRAGSPKSMTPGGFDLHLDDVSVRVLVDRTQSLHLNQGYLNGKNICVVGRVVSVPRRQVRACAISVLLPTT